MSINQITNKIKSLEREIEKIGKDIESEAKKEAGYLSAVSRTKKTIPKNATATTLRSKQRTIQNNIEKADKCNKKQSELQEAQAKKRTELAKKKIELEKAQKEAFHKLEKKQMDALDSQKKLLSQIEKNSANHFVSKDFDFFISHASEDKESIAEPLANALQQKGASVWYDKFCLRVGDSLRESIEEGLAKSRFGIVILSELYFKKFWTGKELNGLFAKQENGIKVILPIWHNVSKDTVIQNSPILADMFALKSADYTIEELADSLIELIR